MTKHATENFVAVPAAYASPNVGGFITGQYYDNAFQGTSGSAAGAANRLELVPYFVSTPFAIDRIGASIATGVASSEIKFLIYDSDANGWPNNLLLETASVLSDTSGVSAEATVSFTFQTGVRYWIGWRQSSTTTCRNINTTGALNLGLNGANGSTYYTIIRRILTYTTAAPSVFGFVASDRSANAAPPSIRMRAA